jgi:RNA recognition motif-containing protein
MDMATAFGYSGVGWSVDRIRFCCSLFLPAVSHPLISPACLGRCFWPLLIDLESKIRGLLPILKKENHMGKKLYVGNLSYDVESAALGEMFAPHGTVESSQIITDRDTGRSKGFGFVEMGSESQAQAAIAAMNGQEVGGRALTVNEAKPKENRSGGGGGGRGYADGNRSSSGYAGGSRGR